MFFGVCYLPGIVWGLQVTGRRGRFRCSLQASVLSVESEKEEKQVNIIMRKTREEWQDAMQPKGRAKSVSKVGTDLRTKQTRVFCLLNHFSMGKQAHICPKLPAKGFPQLIAFINLWQAATFQQFPCQPINYKTLDWQQRILWFRDATNLVLSNAHSPVNLPLVIPKNILKSYKNVAPYCIHTIHRTSFSKCRVEASSHCQIQQIFHCVPLFGKKGWSRH